MKNRRKFIKDASFAGAYGFFILHLMACKNSPAKTSEIATNPKIMLPENAPYNMKYLSGNVGYFTERGGTIGWLADKDNIVVVDTQFPEQSQNLVRELQSMSDAKIDLVINTHHHGDHTAGNIAFKELTEKIVAHENSKKNQEASAIRNNREDTQLYPNTTFTDEWSAKIGNENISIKYYGAAHTDGDSITHFENADVVHMGDLIFNRRFPYIDKSAGANISGWIDVLDKTMATYDSKAKYIFGHSGEGYDVIGGHEDIKAFQNYLEKLLEFGQQSIASGKTLEEVIASQTFIPGAEEWKGKGIERSFNAVYEELTSK